MIRMSVNPHFTLFAPACASLLLATASISIEGSSSVTSLDGKMLFLKTLRTGNG